jgi:hypothetical protein
VAPPLTASMRPLGGGTADPLWDLKDSSTACPALRSRELTGQPSVIWPPATVIDWAGSGLVAGPVTTLPFLTLNWLP